MSSPKKHTPPEPCSLVIFGANGDLTRRKLLPALYNLRKEGWLPEEFAIIGNAREEINPQEFQRRVRAALEEGVDKNAMDSKIRDWIVERADYVSGDSTREDVQAVLRERLEKNQKSRNIPGSALFYFATPPSLFSPITQALGRSGLLNETSTGAQAGAESRPYWRRAVYEKPFGHDLESARALNRDLKQVMNEKQIYRIDHYLGKETVQNMMVLRFANGIYEPIWNRRYIDSVQITVAETLGVEERGSYYDSSGALRDMVPNHLFQLVSLIGMEPPNSFSADDVRNEKVKVLRAIKPLSHEDVLTQVVRGQYEGYRQEPKVKPDSETETFVAMKLEIDNWRWAGVPFYLRTGKKLATRLTEVVIRFRRAPFQLFRDEESASENERESLDPNLLIIQIQPEERIQMRFAAKVPGPGISLGDAIMDFDYVARFGVKPQTGYETLLFDCMKGDATLFQRDDQIEAGWEVVTPIQDVWKSLKARDFPNYKPGNWGPARADELLAKDKRDWIAISCQSPQPKPGSPQEEAA
jgi:glucose-6-phosphate 1-dehydrogenase